MDIINKESGIYKITFKDTDYYYWGKSSSIGRRKNCHLSLLRRAKHTNQKMQGVFNKYGEASINFQIIVICEDPLMTEFEQKLLDRDFSDPNCLNLNPSAESIGFTEEMREKMSVSAKNKPPISEETRDRMKEAVKGTNNPFYGKTHSEETKRKISDANTGRAVSEETRKKRSETTKGRPSHRKGKKGIYSEETLKKWSESRIGEKNPNYGKAPWLGRKHSEETKKRMRDAQKLRRLKERGEV